MYWFSPARRIRELKYAINIVDRERHMQKAESTRKQKAKESILNPELRKPKSESRNHKNVEHIRNIFKLLKSKNDSEKNILEKTEKFHQMVEERKKSTEQKITQMKENALRDIKNISVKISIETVKHLISNSIDKQKLENLNSKSLEQAKAIIKDTRA